MKPAFRSFLTEQELQDKETSASPMGLLERAAFSDYRTFVQQVRDAARNADIVAYDSACTRLEHARGRIDRIVQFHRTL